MSDEMQEGNILRITAAATLFPADTDEFAAKLNAMIEENGIEAALSSVTGLDADCDMIKKIVAMREELM